MYFCGNKDGAAAYCLDDSIGDVEREMEKLRCLHLSENLTCASLGCMNFLQLPQQNATNWVTLKQHKFVLSQFRRLKYKIKRLSGLVFLEVLRKEAKRSLACINRCPTPVFASIFTFPSSVLLCVSFSVSCKDTFIGFWAHLNP